MKNLKKSNIVFIVLIALLIIPQTRKPIQVLLHKGILLINSTSLIDESERVQLTNYDWSLRKEDNELFNFNSTQGKVVVVNFWATWCPPCIAEMSSLNKLYTKFGNTVEFVFVTNDSFNTVNRFMKKNNYKFPVYQMINEAPKSLKTSSIPHTVILNKKGEIVIDKYGAMNWYSKEIITQLERLQNTSI